VYDDPGETPGSLSVSNTGQIAFDDNGEGPALVYASATNGFVDTGLGASNTQRQTAISGDAGFLATTCMTGCVTDQGADSSAFVQDLASKTDTGFPDNLSGADARDEEHPCVDGDGSRVGIDIPNPAKRDVYVRDRPSSTNVPLPGTANSAADDDFFCALDGDGQYLGYFRQTATDFTFRLLELGSGTSVTVPADVAQSNPVWLVAPYSPPPPPPTSPFAPCGQPDGITCATVTVPLDRSGGFPGTVDLAVRRKPAGGSSGALVYLSGGPGSASIPRLATRTDLLAPVLRTRDFVAFDQRGTGLSGFLDCGFEAELGRDSGLCANALGPARAFYHSRDSADDLEAVRQALGVDKIAIYATSYGGVVAYDYASRYPEHVELMILDSPLPPTGWDWRDLSTAAAYRRVLRDLCRGKRCRGITRDPVADVATLVKRLRGKSVSGTVVRANGKRRKITVPMSRVVDALKATDRNPPLRARAPEAFRAAARRDLGPLLRFIAQAGRVAVGAAQEEQDEDRSLSTTLNTTTNCEESVFPWNRDSPPDFDKRLDILLEALNGVPASAYAPFYGTAVTGATVVSQCIRWPHASRAAVLGAAPAPDVPVLLLAGEHDLRTPLADARALAGRFPRSSLVLAEETGHGVLVDPATQKCVRTALERFLTGAPAGAVCRGDTGSPPFPLVPASLRSTPREPGVAGIAGRTLRAVRLAALDARYSWAALAYESGVAKNSGGGLNGGYLSGTSRKLRLKRFVVVPGVVVNGTVDLEKRTASLTVSGSGARGTVKLTAKRISGRLGGRKFSLRPKALVSSASQPGRASDLPDPRYAGIRPVTP
jgi:pimeloyl-ACP methyl ester carboxylesterase